MDAARQAEEQLRGGHCPVDAQLQVLQEKAPPIHDPRPCRRKPAACKECSPRPLPAWPRGRRNRRCFPRGPAAKALAGQWPPGALLGLAGGVHAAPGAPAARSGRAFQALGFLGHGDFLPGGPFSTASATWAFQAVLWPAGGRSPSPAGGSAPPCPFQWNGKPLISCPGPGGWSSSTARNCRSWSRRSASRPPGSPGGRSGSPPA